MIITCEKCSTRFTLDDALVQPQGSKVRCSLCKHIFTVYPDPPAADDEPDFDEPEDFQFDDPGPAAADGDFDSSEEFDLSASEDTTESRFPEESGLRLDGQEFDDQGIDFDEIEFEDDIDFDNGPELGDVSDFEDDTDFDQDGQNKPGFESKDAQDLDLDLDLDQDQDQDLDLDIDLEIDFPEDEDLPDEKEDPTPALQSKSLFLEDKDLKLDDDDPELESLDLDIEDIEPIDEPAPQPLQLADKDDDIEIDFGQEDDPFDLSLEDSGPLTEDKDMDISILEPADDDNGLELVFEDDSDDDLVFEDPADELDDTQGPLELDDDFEAAPLSMDQDEFEPELELEVEVEPDFFIEEEVPDLDDKTEDGDLGTGKFAEYDAVLDEDIDAEVEIPDPELEESPEELMETADTQHTAPRHEEQIDDDMLIGAPSISNDNKRHAEKKGGIGAPVKILILLFLLVIVAFVASLSLGIDIPYLKNINIPYISDILKPAPKQVAHLKPVPHEASINGRFVSNATAGELFIVTGRVDNPSKIAYSNIKVTGTLLDKSKAKVGTQTAYCGNIIQEEMLKQGNISDITKQLSLKDGLRNANVNIKPGGSVLFMLVFSSLPDNLANFTVEVTDFIPQNGKK